MSPREPLHHREAPPRANRSLAARSGTHADSITVGVQGTLTIPPDGEVELDLTVELLELLPEGESVGVRVVGEEAS